jgi:hypothetical protein
MTNESNQSIFITFADSLSINYTTSNLATYQEVALGSTKCHHQHGGIPNTGTSLVLFDHGSMVDERDPYMFFYRLTGHFALQYFKVRITQKRHKEIQDIITRLVAFHTHKLHQSSWIMAQGQMEWIHIFLIISPDSLYINYTTLELVPIHRGNMR